jgi:hypothetical protein
MVGCSVLDETRSADEPDRPRNVVGVDHAEPPRRFAKPADSADPRLPSNRNDSERG